MNLYGKHPCPAGITVGHPTYGRGVVLYGFMDQRMVEFTNRIEKSVEEMTADEIRENTFDGQEVLGVCWIEKTTRVIPLSQLKAFV